MRLDCKRNTSELIPYARNSRTHSEAQIAQIVASIKEFGFTNPVIIDEDNGIIAGHGRVMAAQKLGIDEVPCVQVTGWTKAQKKAYVIADNKLALNAGWDDSMLALEFEELQGMDYDLDLTGFAAGEIEDCGFGEAGEVEMPVLAEGEKAPFQQMTFTLHDEQAEQVARALEAARKMGAFVDTGNENGNGNALARVCEIFVGSHGG